MCISILTMCSFVHLSSGVSCFSETFFWGGECRKLLRQWIRQSSFTSPWIGGAFLPRFLFSPLLLSSYLTNPLPYSFSSYHPPFLSFSYSYFSLLFLLVSFLLLLFPSQTPNFLSLSYSLSLSVLLLSLSFTSLLPHIPFLTSHLIFIPFFPFPPFPFLPFPSYHYISLTFLILFFFSFLSFALPLPWPTFFSLLPSSPVSREDKGLSQLVHTSSSPCFLQLAKNLASSRFLSSAWVSVGVHPSALPCSQPGYLAHKLSSNAIPFRV